jgi:EmrB/QacA subfamily drug resistance transporter
MSIDPRTYERRWKTLLVVSLSLLVIGLDNTILNVALPSLQKEFDASSSTLQWIVDAYLLTFAGFLLTAGTLGDRFGRKWALQAGLALFGGGSLLAMFVQNADQLISVRAAMGAGGALIMPATLSIISNVFPREERQKAIAIWSGVASIGVGLGPLFGGLLLEFFDWSSVFLLNVPVAATALLLGIRLVPNSRDPEPGRFDLVGAGLSTAGLLTLVYGIIEAPERGWTDARVLACFGAALVLLTLFVRWELRTKDPMLNLDFLRNPRFSVAAIGISLASFALFGAIFALTQFLQDAHGYSALQAGAAMVPLAFGLIAGAASSVRLVQRFGTANVMMSGLAGVAVTLVLALLWDPDMAYWPLGLWFFATALSMGWIMGPATSSVMGSVPEEKAGVASAMNDVTREVAGALGTAVVGSLITTLYASKVADAVAGMPADVQDAVKDSIGRANGVASTLPADQSQSLMDAAAHAFTDALGIGFAVAAIAAVVAAVVVKLKLPRAHTPAVVVELPPRHDEDAGEQRRAA